MKNHSIAISLLLLFSTNDAWSVDSAAQWAQWRGPLATGVAPKADPPIEWSETKNIRWKKALPGKGHSTPVIWEDRIYLTAAEPFGKPRLPVYDKAPGSHDNLPVMRSHRYLVLALDRKSGDEVWRRVVTEAFPHEGGHTSGTLASHSPITDGKQIYAFFGSRGLFALNLAGEVVWKADLGIMNTKHAHGEGASPVLHGETIVVNWDHEGESAIHAFDKRTGALKWRVHRDEVTSWATPIVVEHEGKFQVIVSATNRIRAYDLENGKVVWECGGMSNNVVASPVYADGVVIAACSYDTRAIIAIRLAGAKGDITDTANVLWKTNQRTPYVPSPLPVGESLYFLNHYQGVLSCLDPKTGKTRAGPFRLGSIRDVYASPVSAANRIYITDRSGITLVLNHGDEPKPIARNELDDTFSASAALVGKELFLRGERHLYCIAAP